MFHVYLKSHTVCLHRPVLGGLRRGFLPAVECDGVTLALILQIERVVGPHVAEGNRPENPSSDGALFGNIV